jgi:peptidoglycan/LPS O-acetylase OafA/YrhL
VSAQNPRFPLFDSLRAIAALGVLEYHLWYTLGGSGALSADRWGPQLAVGVTVFFLISGFLLYRPFVRARFAGDPPPAVGGYAIRRVLRIVPAYWVALALAALYLGISRPGAVDWLYDYGFAMVYDHGALIRSQQVGPLGQAWTLGVEMSFYVALPIWAFLVRRAPSRTTARFLASELVPLLAIFVLGVVWNFTEWDSSHGLVVFTPSAATLPSYADQFALGMALAVASVVLFGGERQSRAVRVVVRRPWIPWAAAGIAFVALCAVGERSDSAGAEPVRHLIRSAFALGLLLPAVFGDDAGGAARRLLADRRLQWLGLISYSIYLWHLPVLTALASKAHLDDRIGSLGFVVVGTAASIAVAAVSFYAVERPALRLARRLTGRAGYLEERAAAADRPGATAVELAGRDRS